MSGARLRRLFSARGATQVAGGASAALVALERSGPAPLVDRGSPDGALEIAVVIPSFRRGSGGHATIVNLLRALARGGHKPSLWLEDCEGRHRAERADVTRRSFTEFFAAGELELHTDFEEWGGADVVLATGWQTVARVMLLDGAGARAYLVQDHEPDFYGASAERLWAEASYTHGAHCVAASEWLAELLRSRYSASASHFDLGVEHSLYRARDRARRSDLVVFYARAVTPRRAVPLGLAALEELSRRRPDVEIALYGEARGLHAPFAHTHLGVLAGERLAELYSEATVGMVLSLTNPSLIGLEMMACGLPCVELASDSMRETFGIDGPLALTSADPLALCGAIEQLLDDEGRRSGIAAAGVELVSGRTWEHAAEQVEHALAQALRARA